MYLCFLNYNYFNFFRIFLIFKMTFKMSNIREHLLLFQLLLIIFSDFSVVFIFIFPKIKIIMLKHDFFEVMAEREGVRKAFVGGGQSYFFSCPNKSMKLIFQKPRKGILTIIMGDTLYSIKVGAVGLLRKFYNEKGDYFFNHTSTRNFSNLVQISL